MDTAQKELFGSFPRRVGTPSQHWIFNEAQFDLFADTVSGNRNAYATVGQLPITDDGVPSCNSVLFDLDSPAKGEGTWEIFEDEPPDDVVVSRMRSDDDLADEILGKICEEARELTHASLDDGIEVIGVFSGFGLHIHQLYAATGDPAIAMQTCAVRYIEELDLDTPDWAILGQPERICRVPNMERVTMSLGDYGKVSDGRPCDIYQVPLTQEELLDVDPQMLIELSSSPRHPFDSGWTPRRPQMPIWEEYRDSATGSGNVLQRPVDERTVQLDDGVDEILEKLLQMPCMVQRIQQPNPEHRVRLNCAVLLFNVGLNPQQVTDLFGSLGWVDFDRQKTQSYLEGIWTNKYSDMSCQTIRDEGMCHSDIADNPEQCHCYGWSGGQPEW